MNLTPYYTHRAARTRYLTGQAFKVFVHPAERSIFKNIPMFMYMETMEALKNPLFNPTGTKYRVMFRGPRNRAPGDGRSKYSKQSGCLKQFATTFAVYRDTRKRCA